MKTKQRNNLFKKTRLQKLADALQPYKKEIPGYGGRYTITKDAKIYDNKLEREIKPHSCGLKRQNYKQVTLAHPSGYHAKRVYYLMAITFLNHKPDGHKKVIDHVNEDLSNDKLSNLQIISNGENVRKARIFREMNNMQSTTGLSKYQVEALSFINENQPYEKDDNLHTNRINTLAKKKLIKWRGVDDIMLWELTDLGRDKLIEYTK